LLAHPRLSIPLPPQAGINIRIKNKWTYSEQIDFHIFTVLREIYIAPTYNGFQSFHAILFG
jgi:hypothetical protein